jgi:hypothetical protein
MSDLTRRPGNRPTRAQREQRIYQVVVGSSVLGAAGVVLLVLGIIGIGSVGLAILLLIVAAVGGFAARRMLNP